MADSIKIGASGTTFKVGSDDVTAIYLGNTLVYSGGTEPKDYFRFVAKGSGTFTFFANGSDASNTVSYSLDSGSTWTTLSNGSSTPSVLSGDTVYWKGSNHTLVYDKGIGTFSATTDFDVEGNIMSLHFGDSFENELSLSGKDYAFMNLFSGCTNVIETSGMTLPATTLSTFCYTNMFNRCTQLHTSPLILPATTLANGCYYNMFYSLGVNTSLTTTPFLPATTLVENSYRQMFYNRKSINRIVCLATDISATNCTNSWVYSVAASGTFVKAASMTSWATGNNGIPNGWTVQDYNPPTPSYQWVSYQNGDIVPTTTTVYGVKIYMNYDEDYNIIFSGATGDYIRFYPNGNFGQWSAEDENGNPINISSYFDGYDGVYTILFSDLGMGGMNIISPSTTFEDDIELYEIQ